MEEMTMDWTWIRPHAELVAMAKEPAYAALLAEYRKHVDFWEENFTESSENVTGWLHYYVCPVCSGKLHYDPLKPMEHVCPVCGHVAPNTPEILGAWQYCRRYDIEMTLSEAAVLYCIDGQQKDYDFIINVVDYYDTHYPEFDEHGKHAGRGRIMGQSLDEAVWAVYVMRALMMIGFDGCSEMGKRWYKNLFLPLSRLVVAQSNTIHNIPLWHEACSFCAGLFFGDEWLADRTYGGDLGLREQILRGFTDDGIWHENSTGYHYYSTTAATHACLFARAMGVENKYPDLFARVIKAYTAPLLLRFRSGEIPAFNDCSKEDCDQAVQFRLDQYIEAAHIFAGMPGAQAIADVIGEFDTKDQIGMLLYPVQVNPHGVKALGSVNLTHNKVATLRSEQLEVFCKYGNLGPSHAHADALEITIPPFSFDAGNPNYGSPLYRGWYTQTMAHNTFVVNETSQERNLKGESTLSADGQTFEMHIDGTYPGAFAKRNLHLAGNKLEDTLKVTCQEASTLDWMFHSDGDVTVAGGTEKAELPAKAEPYQYMTGVERLNAPSEVRFALNGKTLTVRFVSLPEGATVYLAQTPGNPSIHKRSTLMVRTHGTAAEVKAEYVVDDENK